MNTDRTARTGDEAEQGVTHYAGGTANAFARALAYEVGCGGDVYVTDYGVTAVEWKASGFRLAIEADANGWFHVVNALDECRAEYENMPLMRAAEVARGWLDMFAPSHVNGDDYIRHLEAADAPGGTEAHSTQCRAAVGSDGELVLYFFGRFLLPGGGHERHAALTLGPEGHTLLLSDQKRGESIAHDVDLGNAGETLDKIREFLSDAQHGEPLPPAEIFGAMKGVFSGPEADAYFGERTFGTEATGAEIRQCSHKELGTGPALFTSLPRAEFEQVSAKPLPGLEEAVARGEEDAREAMGAPELQRRLEAAERQIHRLIHGEEIESDRICDHELRYAKGFV